MMKVLFCVVIILSMAHMMVEPTQTNFTCTDVDLCLVQCMPYLVSTATLTASAFVNVVCVFGLRKLFILQASNNVYWICLVLTKI
ncbi:hypothetical protein MKX03_007228 [Papaver bracteatum]|nr:hypothetical protein MKX03_007228 [Papaver bracteatum]